VPLAEKLAGNTLTLEGPTLEVRGLDDALPHRSCVWIPSMRAIVGGVNVLAGLHLWTADTQSAQERANWSKKLGAVAALSPAVVVPGHSLPGQKQDAFQLAYSSAYPTR
jgi:glyoxylase-like metal-dependent hydrolase (beta-lactamase superfamily II)